MILFDDQRSVESLKIESTDWQSLIKDLEEQLTDVKITKTDNGLVVLPSGGWPRWTPLSNWPRRQ
ncbi:hypothetical protein [Rhodopirellula bahusiensis]|uniref:hypothetical protein n=1 Tax=Rhodopirellula bahusiensis TaxID=2014065 RepID=UPI003265997E